MSISYKNYLLTVLMIILAFSYVDRMVFSVVLENIKSDLHLTDTQLGVLNGFAFALFYAAMAIPIARWSDRGDRIRIISITTGLWSIAVAVGGLTVTFTQLLMARIVVAIGESGCTPLASSLIPNYFQREERPRAAARYLLGTSLGLMVGYLAGGWLNELYGWRMTFPIVAAPGFVLTLVAYFTLREPRRGSRLSSSAMAGKGSDTAVPHSLFEVVGTLWANRSFRQLLVFFSIWYFGGWAISQWLPAFFVRSHKIASGELGTWLSLVYGGSGLLGAWLGGEWGSRFAAANERIQLFGAAIMFAAEGAFYASAFLIHSTYGALGAIALANFLEQASVGPIFATLQSLVPDRMRATAQAFQLLVPSIVGAGLGPLAAGVLSDSLHPLLGAESLRYALILLCPTYVWAAVHLWLASRTISRDLSAAGITE